MTTYELCVKIPQLINSFHKNMFFKLNQKILTPMLEIWLFRYLMELHFETSCTFPGGVLLFYNIFREMLLYLWMMGEWAHVFLLYLETKQHYFICNTPNPMISNSEALKCSCCWMPPFLSVASWIFSSVFCSHLIQILKVISITFWNSVNIWPIWW